MTEPRLLGDRYELGEVLGRGGMAEVRRGRDLRLGRVVAIKMLRVDHVTDTTFQARFRREAQSAASLNHRNVVAVFDTGEDVIDGNRIPYIVMEYVEGQTLRELLHERARFTPERAIEVTANVLDALEYSHRAGIVHRDIKPGNIMITGAGEIKVMDFGIARSLAETGAALTQTAAVVGTAQYISPEQARGQSADARSDLYATGCVLYEMLTGRPPFVGESLVSVAVSHVRETPTPPSALDPSIPRDLDAIVLKALAKGRPERYQSASLMRTDLERCLAGLPISAEATAATQLIGTGGYGDAAYDPAATTMYDGAVDDYADESEPAKKGLSWGALIAATVAVLAVAGLIGYLMFNGGDQPRLISVPELLGQSQQEAQDWADGQGVALQVENREVSDDEQVDVVVQQDPEPGDRVEESETVTVWIGVGPDPVAVPDVVGDPESDARDTIEEAGLTVGDVTETVTEDEEEQDVVLSQNPSADSEVDPDTAVDLEVGVAPDDVSVPNLIGLTESEADQSLDGQGLQLGSVTRESSSEQPEGRVIASDPEFGETVAPDTRVNIVLSSGEETAIVDDVVGQPEQQATNNLQNSGFVVESTTQPTCEAAAGRVVGQDPEANSEQPVGSTVTITVAEEPPEGCPGNSEGGVLPQP